MSHQVDLYEFLQVDRTATSKEIRKAYFALALKLHPDKNPSPTKEEDFKNLKRIYDILSDPVKRERYDRTGCTDDENELFWASYERYRGTPVSEEDIVEYQNKFRESEEEENDLVEYFVAHQGDITNILGSIIASRDEDRARFVKFFKSKLKDKTLPAEFKNAFNASRKCIRTQAELDGLEDDLVHSDSDGEAAQHDDDQESDMDDFIVPDDQVDSENSNMDNTTTPAETEDKPVRASKRRRKAAREEPSPQEVPVKKPGKKKSKKKANVESSEVEDMDALRAAILGNKNRQQSAFNDFAAKWERKSR